jgi:hypothetical protein
LFNLLDHKDQHNFGQIIIEKANRLSPTYLTSIAFLDEAAHEKRQRQ